MRRWLAAALVTSFMAACTARPATPEPGSAANNNRATPGQAGASAQSAAPAQAASSSPTAALPLARPVASPSASPGPSAGAANPAAASFSLQSPSFVDGGTLPTEFTCDGSGQSPPLAWSGAPPGTAAYALVVQEADAPPVGNVAHPITEWLLYNMPLNVTQLPAGVPPRPLLTNGSQQGLNSQQTVGYLGPCPGHGDPPHHVTFQLLAQDGYVTLETAAVVQDVQTALNGHTVGQALLTATFQR